MKLAGTDPSAPHHCCDGGVAVGGGGRQHRAVQGNSGITVHEIHPRGGVVAVQKWAIAFDVEGCPTHVRNSLVGVDPEPFNGTLEQSKASFISFIAAFEQQLKS